MGMATMLEAYADRLQDAAALPEIERSDDYS